MGGSTSSFMPLAFGAVGFILSGFNPAGFVIGAAIGGMLFPPDPMKTDGQKAFSELQVQTAAEGIPVPIVYGTNRISGNVLWHSDFGVHREIIETDSGKGGGASQESPGGIAYSSSFAIGLCEGEITDVLNVYLGKSTKVRADYTNLTILPGTSTATSYTTDTNPGY